MHVYIRDSRGILLTFHGKRLFTPKEELKAAIMRGHIIARLHTLHQESERLMKTKLEMTRDLNSFLSDREREILLNLCTGATNAAIGKELGITKRTVDTHVSNILKRLDLRNRQEVIAKYAHWLRPVVC